LTSGPSGCKCRRCLHLSSTEQSGSKCEICGIEAPPGQVFTRDGVPFFQRYRCPSCHGLLTRKVIQATFLINIAFGLFGVILLAKNPTSEPGRVYLNLFWFALFSYAGILPHELAHAWAGQLAGFRISNVLVGIGPTLLTVRALGFPLQIKSVPAWGVTLGQPTRFDRLSLRYFVFVAAGPLANFSIAGLTWYLTGEGPKLSATSTMTNIFILANLVLRIENLITFSFSSPGHGRVQSDGLSLLKLLLGSEHPFGQTPETARKWTETLQLVFQKLGALLLLLLGLALAGLAARTAIERDVMWFAVFVFGLIGLILIWFAHRVWVHRSESPPSTYPHNTVINVFTAEMSDNGLCLASEFRHELAASVVKQDFATALKQIEEAEREVGINLWLLNAKASALIAQQRFCEAYAVYAEMLERDGLRPETRTMIAIGALQSRLQDGKIECFRSELRAVLETRETPQEKVVVLDSVASFALYDRITAMFSEALQWCEQALALQPENLTVRGTRASLLFEMGDFASSEPELREVCARSNSPLDKGITSLYLALICKLRCQPEEAVRLARQAQGFCQMPFVLARLAVEFPDAQSAT